MMIEEKLDEPAQSPETFHGDASISMPRETSDMKESDSQGCTDPISSYFIGRVSF